MYFYLELVYSKLNYIKLHVDIVYYNLLEVKFLFLFLVNLWLK